MIVVRFDKYVNTNPHIIYNGKISRKFLADNVFKYMQMKYASIDIYGPSLDADLVYAWLSHFKSSVVSAAINESKELNMPLIDVRIECFNNSGKHTCNIDLQYSTYNSEGSRIGYRHYTFSNAVIDFYVLKLMLEDEQED